MAWGGLISYTDPYTNEEIFYAEYLDHTTPAERQRIEDRVQNEAENTSGSSQGGDENPCQ